MKQGMRLLTLILFLLTVSGCTKTVTHVFTKNQDGSVLVTSSSDGTSSEKTLANPQVSDMTDLGLSERDAWGVITTGETQRSESSERTLIGNILLVLLIILIIVIIVAALADGDFFTASVAADALEDLPD